MPSDIGVISVYYEGAPSVKDPSALFSVYAQDTSSKLSTQITLCRFGMDRFQQDIRHSDQLAGVLSNLLTHGPGVLASYYA